MNVLLVVGAPTTLTEEDIWVRDRLQDAPPNGLGHTVTLHDDGAAVPDLTGYGLIVLARSAGTANVGAKWDNVTVGVFSLRVAPHSKWSTVTVVANTGDIKTIYVVSSGVNDVLLPANTPEGNLEISSVAGVAYYYNDSATPPGVIRIASQSQSGQNRLIIARANRDAQLNDGAIAPSRRVQAGLITPYVNLTAAGKTIFDNAVAWTGEPAPVNQPPTVVAGADQTVAPGAAVTLSGSASDPDGTIASYAWAQTSGTSVTLSGANTATATFTAPSTVDEHALVFRLTATDNGGATGNDSTQVRVGALAHRTKLIGGVWVNKRRRILRSGAWT